MKRAETRSILVAVLLLIGAVKAEAQQPKKVPRIGYLSNTDPNTESTRAEGIRLARRMCWLEQTKSSSSKEHGARSEERGAVKTLKEN